MRHASTRRLPPFSSFFRGDKLALGLIGIYPSIGLCIGSENIWPLTTQ